MFFYTITVYKNQLNTLTVNFKKNCSQDKVDKWQFINNLVFLLCLKYKKKQNQLE